MHAEKENGDALVQTDYVTALNPPSHSLISSINVFIGETSLQKEDKAYMFISRLNYLLKYSLMARKSFLKTFEGYEEDFHEDVAHHDISTCYVEKTKANGTKHFVPSKSQGIIAELLLNKKKQKYRIGLHTVLSATR